MAKAPSLSVCLAMYNGGEFLREQIDSILAEIGPADELLVFDDGSKDDSVALVRSIGDHRIKVFINATNLGTVRSFERALTLAKNDVIFLADQDDVWVPGRVKSMLAALEATNAAVVSGGSLYIDRHGNRIEVDDIPTIAPGRSAHHAANIWEIFSGKIGYFGCAMAVRRDFLPTIVPFPPHVESHDLWIAMASNLAGRNVHVDEAVLYRRIHGSNLSYVKRPFIAKMYSRLVFVGSLSVLLRRIYFRADAARR